MFRHKILFLILIFLSFSAKAQLDLEHWFPPVFSSGGNVNQFYIYLSTDKTTPFNVKIYSDNQEIGSVMLSKSQPVSYQLQNYQLIYLTAERLTMTPQKFGLHLAGEKSFYASLRISGTPSTVISSKGKTALGEEFFAGMEQNIKYGNPRGAMNYQISVMATQDNTHVKLSNYDNRVVFADKSTADELNFTLNKGESYMIVALKKDADPMLGIDDFEANLIGAKITSDKPIVVDNGNFESHYFGETDADITMDQVIPTSKIGKEYFLISGMSPYKSPTERALIIATKDNTKVFFNDDSQPTKTLNSGEYFFTAPYLPVKFIKGNIPNYIIYGKTVETGGMYIKTSEPAYVYQISGGLLDAPPPRALDRTFGPEGMLLSFPLDKDYSQDPRQNLENLVQIPKNDEIGSNQFNTKVSVKAPSNANVKINGFTPPFSPIIGKPGWSYFTTNSPGTLNITSDKPLNVDAVGGRKFSGFGSSYTAFSNDPFIIVNGNCLQEFVYLTVSNTQFDKIQWRLNGIDILGANSSTFEPKLAGIYTCALSYADFIFETVGIKVENCPYSISTKDIGDVCPNFMVKPEFSPPNENFKIFSTEILTQPQNGKVVLNNGILNATMNSGFSGKDRFVYKITAENDFYEVVKIEFNTLSGAIADLLSEIRPKNIANRVYFYNLLSAILNLNNETFVFYETEADARAETNSISLPENYETANPTFVFVRVLGINGCFVIKKINLLLPYPSPNDGNLFPNVFTPNGDGFNDEWNYSVLQTMENVQLQLFDRYGKLIFKHTSQNSSFKWNGLGVQQKKLKTQTLWVVYSYYDPIVRKIYQGTQWVLLKNR
ncbi:T9SS type B sorting domain-containing protein [Halpernia sp.]|uniref:T9SS type B sorting domain-containing protein n=1 Tax=Halpernia sp. TaxID=2782209 RepID=UPI003A939D04